MFDDFGMESGVSHALMGGGGAVDGFGDGGEEGHFDLLSVGQKKKSATPVAARRSRSAT